jgi:hypothetical protein
MWALVWLQLVVNDGGGINYYHLGTYGNINVCEKELERARIIIENPNEAIACLELLRSNK